MHELLELETLMPYLIFIVLQVYPIRIATCNLHGQHTRSGITAHIQNVRLRNFICGVPGSRESTGGQSKGTSGYGEAASVGGVSGAGALSGSGLGVGAPSNDTWLEAAAVIFGPLYVDAAISSNILYNDMQLIQDK